MRIRSSIALLLLILPVLFVPVYGQKRSGNQLRHSDIFVSQLKSRKSVEQYHVTGVAWGFLPHPLNNRTMNAWRRKVRDIHSMGLKFQARIEFDARWENMIDYDPEGFRDNVMRTLDGEYLVAPWFAEREYKGYPAYWFCSNAPGFREYLEYQADHVLSGHPDFIMLDAQTSTALPLRWYGGCFCHFCLEGFNQFLEHSYSKQELSHMGIGDTEHFNYAEFLGREGYNDKKFKEESRLSGNEIPLFGAYQNYHVTAINELSRELSKYIDHRAGHHVVLSTSSPAHQPYRSVIIPELSHYTLEMGQDAARYRVPHRTIIKYKMAEAVDKRVIVTALPKQDWKLILEDDLPGLVRTWIAQAYGYGANFIAPVNQWASGTRRFKGDPDDFTDLYDFIHYNASLLDGYNSMARTGLLITNSTLREGGDKIDSVIYELTRENIPFRLILVPDEWWDFGLDPSDLESCDAFIMPFEPDHIHDSLYEVLKATNATLIFTGRTDNWIGRIPHSIEISAGNENLTLLPRRNPENTGIPYVCHLLNLGYDKDSDRVISLSDVKIQLSASLFDGGISGATYYRPGEDPVSLDIQLLKEGYSLIIPSIDEWGIIALRCTSID